MVRRKRDKTNGMVYDPSARNRGEDFSEPRSNLSYDMRPDSNYKEHAPNRRESRDVYTAMYDLEMRRDQRAFARTQDPRSEFYAGVDPRRKQELADGGMVRESRADMANLPRTAIHCEYPRDGFYATPYLDDIVRD